MKKREYPKTVFKKKLMKSAFWTAFALVFFLSVVAIVRVGNAGAGAAENKSAVNEEQKQSENLAAAEGGQTFAENFAVHYFSWTNTDEEKKKRVERLKPYLAKGLDEQAGLSFEGMKWNSLLGKSQVWAVEETGKDTALITLRVIHNLTQAGNAKKQAGSYEKYFVVPVKTDGESFVVYKIPYFTASPGQPEITAETDVEEQGQVNNSELKENITSYLNTFFKVYTTGTQEELSYYVKDDSIKTMKGIMTFIKVENTVIQKGKGGDYQIYANVAFQEDASKAQVIYPYEITITKEDDRWFVKELKNQ